VSVHGADRAVTVPDLRRMKGTPQVWLTAYTTPMAKLLDPHCDVLLVGDSLGMVLYGLPSTLGVSLDTMIAHGAAVVRGVRHACVVVDMPFGSYQETPALAYRHAARVLAETGAQAVKLEGGTEMAATIRFLTQRESDRGRARGGRSRRVRRGGGRHAGAGRGRDHCGDCSADDRHRRLRAMRRAGAGDRRFARHVQRFHAAFC
jgi:3-methyl-2-oxobutanoate hydroxymethyltransferase